MRTFHGMSEENFYRIAADGLELGVRTESQLRAQWNAGFLEDNAYFLDETANDWRPVGSLLGPRISPRALPPRPAPEMTVSAPASPYVLPPKTAPYRTPILANIFKVLGGLALIGGFFVMLIGFGALGRAPESAGALMAGAVAAGALTGGVIMFQGIVLLGAGQVIDYVGRIAFQTERTANLLAARP